MNTTLQRQHDDDTLLSGHPLTDHRGRRFTLTSRLDHRGEGEAWLAHDGVQQRSCVLKLLNAPMPTRQELARFLRAARRAARLRHEHIVTVHDFGLWSDERPYLVLEHLEGETLQATLEREGPLGLERALEIACAVLRGLDHAHKRGVLHRDVRPARVLLTADGEVKLLDFGIAHIALEQADTFRGDPGDAPGAAHAMAPEQFDWNAEPRTDLWGVGVMLHQLVSGEVPFDAPTFAGLITSIFTQPPRRLRCAEAGAGELEQLIGRALRKEPEERFASAAEMLLHLKALRAKLTATPRALTLCDTWSDDRAHQHDSVDCLPTDPGALPCVHPLLQPAFAEPTSREPAPSPHGCPTCLSPIAADAPRCAVCFDARPQPGWPEAPCAERRSSGRHPTLADAEAPTEQAERAQDNERAPDDERAPDERAPDNEDPAETQVLDRERLDAFIQREDAPKRLALAPEAPGHTLVVAQIPPDTVVSGLQRGDDVAAPSRRHHTRALIAMGVVAALSLLIAAAIAFFTWGVA